MACKQWNGIEAGTIARRKVHEVESGTFPNVTRTFVSCRACTAGEPACAKVCPAGAITKRGEDGIVVVDKEKCIGCHYCFFACPFGRAAVHRRRHGQVRLLHRQWRGAGDTPHCVATCPTQALQFGTMDELAAKVGDKKAKQMAADAKPSVVVS